MKSTCGTTLFGKVTHFAQRSHAARPSRERHVAGYLPIRFHRTLGSPFVRPVSTGLAPSPARSGTV